MIDTLTRDRLVLTSAHPVKDGELMWVYRFQRDKASSACFGGVQRVVGRFGYG